MEKALTPPEIWGSVKGVVDAIFTDATLFCNRYAELVRLVNESGLDVWLHHPVYLLFTEILSRNAVPIVEEYMFLLFSACYSEEFKTKEDIRILYTNVYNKRIKTIEIQENMKELRENIDSHLKNIRETIGGQMEQKVFVTPKFTNKTRKKSTFVIPGRIKSIGSFQTVAISTFYNSKDGERVPFITFIPSKTGFNDLHSELIKVYRPLSDIGVNVGDEVVARDNAQFILKVLSTDDMSGEITNFYITVIIDIQDKINTKIMDLDEQVTITFTVTKNMDPYVVIRNLTEAIPGLVIQDPDNIERYEKSISGVARVFLHTPVPVADPIIGAYVTNGQTVPLMMGIGKDILKNIFSGISYDAEDTIKQSFTIMEDMNPKGDVQVLYKVPSEDNSYIKCSINTYYLTSDGKAMVKGSLDTSYSDLTILKGEQYLSIYYENVGSNEIIDMMLRIIDILLTDYFTGKTIYDTDYFLYYKDFATITAVALRFPNAPALVGKTVDYFRGTPGLGAGDAISFTALSQALIAKSKRLDNEVDNTDDLFIRQYAGPGDNITSINRYNRYMFPEVFIASEHSRRTEVGSEPLVVDDAKLYEWYNYFRENGAADKFDYIQFPWPSHPHFARQNRPLFNVICKPLVTANGVKWQYPGIKVNKSSNKDVFPYVPVCRATKQKPDGEVGDTLYSRVYLQNMGIQQKSGYPDESRTQKPTLSDKIARPGRYGFLQSVVNKVITGIVSQIFPDRQLFRYGVTIDENSLIHSVLRAMYTDLANYFAFLDASPNIPHGKRLKEAMTDYYRNQVPPQMGVMEESLLSINAWRVRNILADMVNDGLWWCLRQEMYDYRKEEVVAMMRDKEVHFSSDLFYRLLEIVFGISIYVFYHLKKPSESEQAIEVPRHKLYHCRFDSLMRTLILYRHSGSEGDNNDNPQYELVITNYSKDIDVFLYPYQVGSSLLKLLYKTHNYIEWKLGYAGFNNMSSVINPKILFPEDPRLIQHFDGYGKLRAVTSRVYNMTVFIPPTACLSSVDSIEGTDADIKSVPYALIANNQQWSPFTNPYTIEAGKVFWEVGGIKKFFYAYISNDVELDGFRHPQNVDSIFNTRMSELNRKLSIIVQLMTWVLRISRRLDLKMTVMEYFIRYLLAEPTAELPQDNYEVDKFPVILPNVFADILPGTDPLNRAMSYIQSNSQNLVKEGKFTPYNARFRDAMLQIAKMVIRNDSDYIPPYLIRGSTIDLDNMNDNKSITFTNIEDYFTWAGSEKVKVVSNYDVQRSLSETKQILTIVSEPYIYEYSTNPVGQLMVQNVKMGSILASLFVSYMWMKHGKNVGYHSFVANNVTDYTPEQKEFTDYIKERVTSSTFLTNISIYAVDINGTLRLIYDTTSNNATESFVKMSIVLYNSQSYASFFNRVSNIGNVNTFINDLHIMSGSAAILPLT